ncbi:MAG: VanZ family protein [Rhodoferax sp.]
MRLKFSAWQWAFVACALAVLMLALIPSPPRMLSTGWDKSNHMLAFASLGALGLLAFPQRLTAVVLCVLCYGALIEVLQSFTPNRSAEWLDLLADAAGIVLGWAITGLMGRLTRLRRTLL